MRKKEVLAISPRFLTCDLKLQVFIKNCLCCEYSKRKN